MLLINLYESSPNNAISQILSFGNKLITLYGTTMPNALMDAYEQGHEPKVIKRLAKMQAGKWFAANYLGNRKNIGIYYALSDIAKDPRFQKYKSQIKEITSIPIFASPELRQEHGVSGVDHVALIAKLLSPLLLFIGNTIGGEMGMVARRLAGDIDKALYKYEDTLKHIEVEVAKDKGKPIKAPKRDDLTGAQQAQVEAIINSVLQDLPADDAHGIRMSIARADNKLARLQLELKRRGLA